MAGTYTSIMTAAPPDTPQADERQEIITRGDSPEVEWVARGVMFRPFVNRAIGGQRLCTGMAVFGAQAEMPWHVHDVSEVVTVLEGQAVAVIEGRYHRLFCYDALHIPAGAVHLVRNGLSDHQAILHLSYASDEPATEFVTAEVFGLYRRAGVRKGGETLRRFDEIEVYEPAPGAFFRDLFASRFGTKGVCGGYGHFQPGAGLPCHLHEYDESITIVEGVARMEAAGRHYQVAAYDTGCVPRGLPHRFVNRSDRPMAMIWVYGGDEPGRTLVDPGQCATGL